MCPEAKYHELPLTLHERLGSASAETVPQVPTAYLPAPYQPNGPWFKPCAECA